RGDACLPRRLRPGGERLDVPAVAGRLERGGPAPGTARHIRPAQRGLAGTGGRNHLGRRRAGEVPVRRPASSVVADHLIARRAGPPGRVPPNDGRSSHDVALGAGGDGARARSGARGAERLSRPYQYFSVWTLPTWP